MQIEITNDSIKAGNQILDDLTLQNAIFIPAERSDFPALARNIFTLLSGKSPVSRTIIDFGARFEKARMEIRKFRIPFLNLTYEYSSGEDYIFQDNEVGIKLFQASNSVKMLVSTLLIIEYYINYLELGKTNLTFIIEKPELNLSSELQLALTYYLKEKIVFNNHRLILDTQELAFFEIPVFHNSHLAPHTSD